MTLEGRCIDMYHFDVLWHGAIHGSLSVPLLEPARDVKK
jgi:hypothetical protein